MSLSAQQIARYRRDGFIVVEDVLSPAEISGLRRVTDALVELLCGEADLVAPRLTNVPVRLPLPPAKRQGSIYESQLELKNTYFGTAEAPRTAAHA